MIRGMFSAISGLRNHQIMLDVTANNLANVNTIGFKSSRVAFKDQLQQTYQFGTAAGPTTGGLNGRQVGLGVQLATIDNQMGSGSLQATGNPFDIAIQGNGWFRVGLGAPPAMPTETQYTRAGNFRRNDQGFLVTADGYYVMGRTGGADAYIEIPVGATDTIVGEDGSVSYVPAGGGPRAQAGTISLAQFPNQEGLTRVSGNRWIADPASGPETVGTPGGTFGVTTSGTIEMSNVDLAAEFTQMIVAQRGFQANSRVISTTDEMLQELVNIKR
jgi:flagellar hook protein FlgE